MTPDTHITPADAARNLRVRTFCVRNEATSWRAWAMQTQDPIAILAAVNEAIDAVDALHTLTEAYVRRQVAEAGE